MNRFKHLVRNSLAATAILGATVGITSPASAAPTGLDCPTQLRIGYSTKCYYRANPSEKVTLRTSNNAVYITSYPWTDENGYGYLEILGEQLGGVTICLYSSNGAFKTCDFVEIVR